MKLLLQILSATGLLLTIIPSVLLFKGLIDHNSQNWLMLLGAVIWFITAYLWLGKKVKPTEEE